MKPTNYATPSIKEAVYKRFGKLVVDNSKKVYLKGIIINFGVDKNG